MGIFTSISRTITADFMPILQQQQEQQQDMECDYQAGFQTDSKTTFGWQEQGVTIMQ